MKTPGSQEIDGNNISSKETISFSIDSGTLSEIRKQAKKDGQSVNSLVNDVLQKYVMLYRHAEEEWSMIVPQRNFRFIMENIDEQVFTNQYANFCLDYIQALFYEHKLPITLENIISYCYKTLALRGGSYHKFADYLDENGHRCLAFTHNYGEKWSRIIGGGFAKQLQVSLGLHADLHVRENTVILKIIERV